MGTRERNRRELRLELAEEVLRSSGELRFIAYGASMIPAIFPGDMLIVRHEPIGDARCGDVVLWARDGGFCAHRVVGTVTSDDKGTDGLTTRGDALEENDPAIHCDDFLGRVHAILRRGKRIELSPRRGLAMRVLAFATRTSDCAARCLLRYNRFMCWLASKQPIFRAGAWRESVGPE